MRCLSGPVCGSSLPEIFEARAEQAASQGDGGVGAVHGPAHAGALEPCADLLASGLDDAPRDAQSPGAELRIAHPVAVAEHIVRDLLTPRRRSAAKRVRPSSFSGSGEKSACRG